MKRLFFGGITALIIFLSCIPAEPRRITEDHFKKEFLDRINLARRKGCNCGHTFMPPAPPLTWNDQLEDAARGHALDMSERNYFSHTGKNGKSASDRIVSAGYNYKGYKSYTAGENIAQGQMSIAEVMNGWLHSEGHCRNLMNPSFKEVGVSVIDHYWVQDFGGREPFSPEEQKMIKSGRYRLIQKEVSRH
jgi:uncharacterized protein YkwD